ncbi:MAG: DNRLRE domain-containing protein [Myxococcota bacterium]
MRVAYAVVVPRILSLFLACAVGCSDSQQTSEVQSSEAAITESIDFTTSGDTYLRDGSPNKNQGDETFLRVRKSGKNRALLQFDQVALENALAGQGVAAARIELDIVDNGGQWGSAGRSIGVHRMTGEWTEPGATWNCGDDADTSNGAEECPDTAWDMKNSDQWPFLFDPTSTVLVYNETEGVFAIDVTADVQAFVAGEAPNLGWILRLVNETQNGRLDFASRETVTPPKLIVVPGTSTGGGDPPQCIATRVGGDTFVRRGAPNQNQGGIGMLRVRSSGHNRALVQLSAQELIDATTGQTVELAELKFTISKNGSNWGPDGREVDLHRMLVPWGELTATWDCSSDLNIGNQAPDCEGASAWDMDAEDGTQPYDPTPIDTVLVTNDTAGSISFDITTDVQDILAGGDAYGWIIRKRDEPQAGLIELVSSEASATAAAQIITCSDGDPTPLEDCRNGIDDDEDGDVDCADSDCQIPGPDATCDGIDDDCDGVVDEDFAPETTDCGVGACAAAGQTTCSSGVPGDTCVPGTPAADDATCDGTDDDCDGATDEDFVGTSTTCGVGACVASGNEACVGGQVQNDCTPGTPAASDAACDLVDEDCDGAVDEDYVSSPTTCGVGACVATGATACVGGAVEDQCVPGTPAPSDAVCDLIDEDCNGVPDEDYVSLPTSCGLGLCAAVGATSCVSGAIQDSCQPGVPAPADATCDGFDEDCDGSSDEDYVPVPTACGVGACASNGLLSCLGGALVDSCTPGVGTPDDATCDGIDDDCDGEIDEDVVVDDGNPCTVDSCDPLLGLVHEPLPEGTACDDGDACTGGAVCDSEAFCQAGVVPVVDDGNPCTIDSCDPFTGVTHDLAPEGTPCVDWDPCNGDEVCDSAGQCLDGVPPTSGPCLTDGPMAAFSVPEEINATDLRYGATVVASDVDPPTSLSDGRIRLVTGPNGATITIDLRGDLQVLGAFEVQMGTQAGVGFPMQVRVSDTGIDPDDFSVIYDGPSSRSQEVLPLPRVSARYVQLYLSRPNVAATLEVFSAERKAGGGLVSLLEGGAEIVEASSQRFPASWAISTNSRAWQTLGNVNEFFTVKLRDEVPVLIDRMYIVNPGSTPSGGVRDFEVWVSESGLEPEDFTRVLVGTLLSQRPRWYFIDPIRARYVKFVALNNYGFRELSLASFQVYSPSQGSVTSAFEDRSLAGTSDVVSWEWTFGDGTQSLERNPIHTFPEPGMYPVVLRVTDENGLYDVFQTVYRAKAPPIASFQWDPPNPVQRERVQVTDTSSPGDHDLLDANFRYFGNLSAAVPPGGGFAFDRDSVSSNDVTLVVRDVTFIEASTTRAVGVGNALPTLDGAPEQLTLFWGEVWNLGYEWSTFDWGSDDDRFTCTWDFGDGQTASVPSGCNYYGSSSASTPPVELDLRVPHAYEQPGSYVADLTLSDPNGGDAAVSIPVTVTERTTQLVIEPLEGPVDGPTTVAATLIDASDGNGRVEGRAVRFTLREQTALATTDADGRVEVTLDLINGPNNVMATFDGDSLYFPSEDTKVLPREIKPPGPDACGTDFILVFNDNDGSSREAGNYLFLASSVDQVARVVMNSVVPEATDQLVRVPEDGLSELFFPVEARLEERGAVDDRVIRVTATFEICVYGLNVNVVSTDGFIALPTDVLGTEYVVSGFPGRPLFTSGPHLSVVATEDDTEVVIVPTTRLDHRVELADGSSVVPDAGVPVTIALNANQAMHFGSAGADISGTRVSASAPVAVFGGNSCGLVPTDTAACDHQVTQFTPVETWDDHFVAAPFATRESGYFLGIVVAEPDTEVSINGSSVATLSPGERFLVDVDDDDPGLEYVEIETSGPAQIMQYAKGLLTDNVVGSRADPFMVPLVPSSQWNSDYQVRTIPNYELPATFKLPALGRDFINYINIIARSADIGGIRLDGQPVPTAFTPIGSSGYAAAQVPVSSGEHSVTHLLSTTPIGVYVYGWEVFESYAYPGDMRMVPLADGCQPSSGPNGDGLDGDCDGRFDEELANGIDDDGDGLIDEDITFEQPDPVNVPPSAFSQAGTMLEDTTATFVLNGFDANNDPLTFAVTSLPAVGVLSLAGSQVTYTPPPEFHGNVSFSYRSNDGELSSTDAVFTIRVAEVNDPPEITSDPIEQATEEVLYSYPLTVTDVDGPSAFSFSLDEAPLGMQVGSSSGLITWFPDNASTFMSNPVVVRVTDVRGAFTTQSFSVSVANENDPPVVVSSPPTEGFAGFAYEHTVQAEDPDPLDTVTYSFNLAPAGASIDPSTGVISWIPSAQEIGRQIFVVFATDAGGLVGRQTFTVDVAADATPPIATLTAEPLLIAPGEETVFQVTASDETGIASIDLVVDGTPLALDAQNQATYTAVDPGPHPAVLTVTDNSGNVLVQELNIGVFGGSDDGPPSVALTAPSEDDVLTYLHNVVGTVNDANLLEYTVGLRYRGGGEEIVLARRYNSVVDGSLATLDTTLVQNGYYDLEVRAADTNGNLTQASRPVRIDGGAKVGVVQLGFVDASLETLGIPLTVVRRYDSRDKREGDFGVGWRLDVKAGSVRSNRPAGDGFAIYTSDGSFALPCQEQFEQKSHFTEVRLSDSEYYLFRPFVANVQAISGGCVGEVFFEFVDGSGTVAELVADEDPSINDVRASAVSPTSDTRLIPPSFLISTETGGVYNPRAFQMRLPDGRVFFINEEEGITEVRDANGNAVGFQDDAIFHSDGAGIQVYRDARGRIERIVDPMGNEVSYNYAEDGDLLSVVDQLGGVTQYLYESPIDHHLTGIIDRQGQQVAAMGYTRDGRLRQLCDADGGCVRNDYDLENRDWTFFDATDRPVRRKYDERGNVREETDGLDHTTKYAYDSKDRLISIEDPTGATTTFGYDARGNLKRRTEPFEAGEDPAEFTTTFDYDDGDRLTRETLPSGGAYTWEYDAEGNQRFLRDGDDNVLLERTFGPRGEVLTETDRFGTVTFTYDPGSPQPTTMETPDGVVTAFTYDAAARLRTRTRNGVVTGSFYDAAGRPAFSDYGNGVTVRYEYGSENTWTAIEGPTFGRVERDLSAMGRLLGWTLANGDSFSRFYDPQGRVRVETDELGNDTLYDYDIAGRLETVTDVAAANITTFERDPAGRAERVTDGLGGERSMTYFPDGRIRTMTQLVTENAAPGCAPPAPRTTTFDYTPTTTTVTDPLNRDTLLVQNLYGLPARTEFPGGSQTSSQFEGQTVRDEAQFFPTVRTDELLRDRNLTYSSRSALDRASDLSGAEWQYGYEVTQGSEVVFDVFSGEVSLGLREGREGLQDYRATDAARQAWPEHEEDGYAYRLKRTVSPEGETTTWHFNAQGRVDQVDYPFSGSQTHTYDSAGQLDLVSRPDGVSLDYDFDVTGRELQMNATDGTVRSFVYGAGDRVDTMTDLTGTTTFLYDPAGRAVGHEAPAGSITQTRDALGRVESLETNAPVLSTPFPSEYRYDEEGRLLWMRDRRGRTVEMRYDTLGRLTFLNHGQTTCSGGTTAQTLGPSTTWTYDDRDRIESVVHRGPPPGVGFDGPVLLSRTYERNDAGEPETITHQDGSYVELDYDPAGRVEEERYFDGADAPLDTITYAYDLDGNRTKRTSNAGVEDYVYDTGSRLTEVLLDGVETQRFEYDENGRVTRIVRDGQDQQLTWDALDRLVRIEDVNFLESPADFTYDGQGRRVGRDNGAFQYVVGPTGNQSLESPHLVHNGITLSGELVYSGEHALWRYGPAPGPSEPIETRVYLRDAMGSVIGLMDPDGTLVEEFEYDAFGNLRGPGGEALPATLLGGDSRFQGMWKDAGTGLYYVRARYYDARTGRFLSRDPAEGQLETPESFYPYVFANNNPYVFRDPTGLRSLQEFGAAIMARAQLAAASLGSAALKFKRELQNAVRFGVGQAQRLSERAVTLGSRVIQGLSQLRGGPPNLSKLQIVPSAQEKLARVADQLGRSSTELLRLVQQNGKRVVDLRNQNNINIFAQIEGKLIRVTLNPQQTRIISAGREQFRAVFKRFEAGTFDPLDPIL